MASTTTTTTATDIASLGQTLLDLVHNIGRLNRSQANFKKEFVDLSRRISLLTHLFEEIKESNPLSLPSSSSSSSSSSCLEDLLVVLIAAKRLLIVSGSSEPKIFLNNETSDSEKKIVFEFKRVTWLLEKALQNLPYNHFGISDEVREQVELVRTQLRRAVDKHGPLTAKLFSRSLSQPHGQKVDFQESSRRVFGNMNVEDVVDLPDNDSEITLATIPDIDIKRERDSIDKVAKKNSEEVKKTDSVVIPDDFRCPISLELMRDPVIVSTGQTYERSCIQRWIDCGNKTCPKTQQMLQNLTLTPNYVLRSLITLWCEKHNVEQPMRTNGRRRKSDGSFHDFDAERATINALVRKLSSRCVEDRRRAASEIRSMSKRSTDNRILVAEAGAIPVLVNLLTVDDARTQEHVVTSILNLSIYENNKGLIILAGAVPSIVQVLRMGSMEARENAAATLFSLSLLDENKITIGASGAIPALVDLLRHGSARGKKDAASALFNLCIYQGNKGRAVRAGILQPIMKMLTDLSNSMVDEALTILSVLACHSEGKTAITKASVIPVLIDLMRTGQPRNKENAAAILLALCKKDAENLACLGRLGAVVPLSEISKNGTERAKRKANALLEHLRKSLAL